MFGLEISSRKILSIFLLTIIICKGSLVIANTPITIPLCRDQVYTATQDIDSISIDDKEIIKVDKYSKRKMSISGKSLGKTMLTLYNDHDEIIERLEVTVIQDIPGIKHSIKKMFSNENVGLDYVDNNIIITGSVSNEDIAQKIISLVQKLAKTTPENSVINFMNTNSSKQVMIRVRVGEVRKNAIHMLGNSITMENKNPDSSFHETKIISDAATPPGLFGYKNIASFAYTTASKIAFNVLLSAMEKENLFKVLAEPNLVAISGQTAKFHAGNEIAIPVAQSNGVNTVEYKPTGVSVDFTPTVISDNRIRIVIEPEVSEIVDGYGTAMPNIGIRRAKTTVELAPGESFMIAGLIKNTGLSKAAGVPFAKKIPIISSLFRAVHHEEETTELVISVTPYIVNPIENDDIRLPTDDFHFPSVLQDLVLGEMLFNKKVTKKTPILEGSYGYIMD